MVLYFSKLCCYDSYEPAIQGYQRSKW